MPPEIFSERFKKLLKEREISQKQLADFLRLSTSIVSAYACGQRLPSFEQLEAIADFFNVDLDYLTGRSDIQNRVRNRYTGSNANVVRIAGRDGSYEEHTLTDEQLATVCAMVDQFPDADDDQL